jgi:hypothetical protein
MWRYWMGAAAALLLAAGGILWWHNTALAKHGLPKAPAEKTSADDEASDVPPQPPVATDQDREQKRFSRADHDKNGVISRDEFLAARRRNFAKLDVNGDGKLSFEEYAAKAEDKFDKADADKSGGLNPKEFAATRVERKAKPSCACQPRNGQKTDDGE